MAMTGPSGRPSKAATQEIGRPWVGCDPFRIPQKCERQASRSRQKVHVVSTISLTTTPQSSARWQPIYLRARPLRRLAATSRVIWHRRKINNPGAHSFFFNLR